MKYVLMLFMAGCGIVPKFKVGDCLSWQDTEKWERGIIYKITEIGKTKYHTMVCEPDGPSCIYLHSNDILNTIKFTEQDYYDKVECYK